MNSENSLSDRTRIVLDLIIVGIVTLLLLINVSEMEIIWPSLSWVTAIAVFMGYCGGYLFWKYAREKKPGPFWPGLWGYSLVVAILGILIIGAMWIILVPTEYSNDSVYGALSLIWSAKILSWTDYIRQISD